MVDTSKRNFVKFLGLLPVALASGYYAKKSFAPVTTYYYEDPEYRLYDEAAAVYKQRTGGDIIFHIEDHNLHPDKIAQVKSQFPDLVYSGEISVIHFIVHPGDVMDADSQFTIYEFRENPTLILDSYQDKYLNDNTESFTYKFDGVEGETRKTKNVTQKVEEKLKDDIYQDLPYVMPALALSIGFGAFADYGVNWMLEIKGIEKIGRRKFLAYLSSLFFTATGSGTFNTLIEGNGPGVDYRDIYKYGEIVKPDFEFFAQNFLEEDRDIMRILYDLDPKTFRNLKMVHDQYATPRIHGTQYFFAGDAHTDVINKFIEDPEVLSNSMQTAIEYNFSKMADIYVNSKNRERTMNWVEGIAKLFSPVQMSKLEGLMDVRGEKPIVDSSFSKMMKYITNQRIELLQNAGLMNEISYIQTIRKLKAINPEIALKYEFYTNVYNGLGHSCNYTIDRHDARFAVSPDGNYDFEIGTLPGDEFGLKFINGLLGDVYSK